DLAGGGQRPAERGAHRHPVRRPRDPRPLRAPLPRGEARGQRHDAGDRGRGTAVASRMAASAATAGTTHHHLDRAASATMLALCALWGLGQVTIKVANAGISPGVQAGLRSIGAALLVLLWARLRGVRLFARDGTWRAGIAAGLLFALEFMLI